MAEAAFVGAAAGLALTVAYDALKAAASSVRSVVFLRKICAQLEEDLKLYEPYFKQVFVTIESRMKSLANPSTSAELRDLEEAILDFKEKIEKGTKLLEDCEQIKIWEPWRRIRIGKKILRLQEEIRQFMEDNRLSIMGNSQIQEQLDKSKEAYKEFHKKLSKDMTEVKESMSVMDGKVSIVLDSIMSKLDPTSSSSSSSSSSSLQNVELMGATPRLPDFVVGLEDRVGELKHMLLSTNNEAAEKNSKVVAIVGGMGGIGKTTLAMAICKDKQVKDFFQNRIYFFTVSHSPDMVALCSTIWSKVTGDKDVPHFQNSEDASMQLQCKLESHMRNSKCLLVLDDVWSKKSMEKMTFNIPGFWTLVTTRNAKKLKTIETLQPYNLGLLDPQNARQLFCYWAFNQEDIPSWANKTLVEEVISKCKGLPLALKVIGRSLSNMAKNEEVWRRTRKKLQEAEALEKDEQELLFDCLKTSVDDLDEQLRDCFLDLGAFPEDSWTRVDHIMEIWMYVRGMDYDEAYCALTELAHRCLLDLNERFFYEDGVKLAFSQHDVLRDLSIQLGRRNNSPQVEKWRWLLMPQKQPSLPHKWQLSPFTSLAAAQIISIHIAADGMKSTIGDQNWPSLSLPNGEALLWYHDQGVYKDHIYQLPFFIGNMPKLKVLIVVIKYRSSLEMPMQPSWENLKVLDITCEYLRVLAIPCDHLLALQKLILRGCNSLGELPHGIGNLQSLKELKLSKAQGFKSLPENLSNLSSLETLDISRCSCLKHLPHGIGQLKSLKELKLSDARSLEFLPNSLSELISLEMLDISGCINLKHLPHGIGQLQSLKELKLEGALSLESLPESLSELTSLEMLDLSFCWSLNHLPHGIRQLPSLKRVLGIMDTSPKENKPQSL